MILVWHTAKSIYIWTVEKEELLQTVAIVKENVHELRISEDGSTVFYKNIFFLGTIDVQTGHVVGQVEFDEEIVTSFLGVDGSMVWMNSIKNNMGWNFRTSC